MSAKKPANILEIVNQINRVSGITTFSNFFFQHPYLASFNKITITSRPYLDLFFSISRSDVVYCHQLYSIDIFVITLFCILCRKRLILVSHGNLIIRQQSRYKKLFFLAVLRKILLLCKSSTQFLNESEKKRSIKITSSSFICPPYLNCDSELKKQINTVTPPGSEMSMNNVKYKFCYLGASYYERKGFDRMFTMCSALIKAGKNIKLDLIGVHKTDMISEKVKQFQLNDVVSFIEPVYGEEKLKKLVNYDAMFLFSRSEGWPMVVLEAINLKLPVIVSQETNIAELVNKYEVGVMIDNFTDFEWIESLGLLALKRSEFCEDHKNNAGFAIIRDKFLCR
jgi:glycosyltransferase involved in cell wall biosynthesis